MEDRKKKSTKKPKKAIFHGLSLLIDLMKI